MTQGWMIVSFAGTFILGVLIGSLLARSRVIVKVGGTIEVQAATVREAQTLFQQAHNCVREAASEARAATPVGAPR